MRIETSKGHTTLITGATGYVGGALAKKLLKTTDDDLILLVRSHPNETFEERKKSLLNKLGSSYERRILIVDGHLEQDAPFKGVKASSVTRIIHAAATTAFNVERPKAKAINVDGLRKVLDFARTCPSLERFYQISTIYSAGKSLGIVQEDFVTRPDFANYYEWSKWEAENLIRSEYSDLPWNILRVATIAADDNTGAVTQHNAIHNTLKLFYYGLISLAPGNSDCPVYLVTGDFTVKGIFSLLKKAPLHEVVNICHSKEESVSLGDLLNIAYEGFLEDESFKKRGVKPLILVSEKSFDLLVGGTSGFGSEVLKQALDSISPFASQLYIDKDFSNKKIKEEMPDYVAPDPKVLAKNTVGELLKTKFGRNAP